MADHAAKVLAQRAAALARPRAAPPAPADALLLLEFSLGPDTYAIETRHVREVQAVRELTPLPGAPPWLPALTNLRGHLLAVLDLRRLLADDGQGLSNLNRLIVLEHPTHRLALLADAVRGVARVPVAELAPPLPTLPALQRELLVGLAPGPTAVLDFAKLIAHPRLSVRNGA
jgi:purine-binding chemotaxis protein CheW